MAALEAGKLVAPGRACPSCKSEMNLVSEQPDALLGRAGIMQHELKCPECNLSTIRKFSPGMGYI